MKLTNGGCAPTKVRIELPGDTSHDLFEAGQLVLEVLQGVVENIYFGILLPNYLTKVVTLTES